jgi:PKD repeat protein
VYAADGSYSVTLTVTDDAGASATTTQEVTVSASSEPGSSVFSDHFADGELGAWSPLRKGQLTMVEDATYGWVLRKHSNNDPNGGWAPLGTTLSDFELVLFARKVNTTGGSRIRYSLTDSTGNGYGVNLAYGHSNLTLERRTNWGATALAVSDARLSGGMQLGQWYTLRLVRSGSVLSAEVYLGRVTPGNASPELSVTASDSAVTAFTQVNVNGGYEFDTDDVWVQTVTAPLSAGFSLETQSSRIPGEG